MTEPAETCTGFTGVLSFTPEEGWQPQHAREEVELLAVLPDEPVAPNLVATVNPFAGDIRDFAQRAIAGLRSALDDFRLIDVSGWEPAPLAPEPDEPIGELENSDSLTRRRIEYVHRVPGGKLVSGAEYLFIQDDWAVQVTTTCSIQDRLMHHEAFERMVRSTEVLKSADPVLAAEAAQHPSPSELDDVASDAFGSEVESLVPWADQPPLLREGEFIHAATLMQVGHLNPTNPVNLKRKLFRPRGLTDEVIADMTRLHLLDAERRPTRLGAFFCRAMEQGDINIQVIARLKDGQESLLQIAVSGDTALVVAQPGFAEHHGRSAWRTPGPDHYWVEVLPADEVSHRILEWTGAAPSWNLHALPVLVPTNTFAARAEGSLVPVPHEANPAMGRLWGQPWWHWTVRMESQGWHVEPTEYVCAGTAGPYAVMPLGHEGQAPEYQVLSRTPAHLVFWQLEDRLQAVANQRDTNI
ncbi:hypothetical protein [Nesterenkonia suensis]